MFSIPAFDGLPAGELDNLVHEWAKTPEEVTTDRLAIEQAFQGVLPRNIFLKTLARNAEVLDVGAGDGSLGLMKRWPLFERPDLRLYALSLEVGAHFDLYDGYEIKNFEVEPDVFADRAFDAIICAHFIEHMNDPRRVIEFFARKVRPNGRLYIEWPHPVTKKLPSTHTLADRGIELSTFNFFDDGTHVDAWPAEMIVQHFEDHGFTVETGGRVYLPWLGDQLRDHARREACPIRMTLAAWAAFGWAQYLILNRS